MIAIKIKDNYLSYVGDEYWYETTKRVTPIADTIEDAKMICDKLADKYLYYFTLIDTETNECEEYTNLKNKKPIFSHSIADTDDDDFECDL